MAAPLRRIGPSVARMMRSVRATLASTAMLRQQSALIMGESMEAVALSRSRLQDVRERIARLTGAAPPSRFPERC